MNRTRKPKTQKTPSDLQVTVLALADLTPYPKNPRHITPAAVNAVAESLAAFGWQQPIVIDPRKVIVAGHTRRQAALQLGWTHAPTVTIPAKHARSYRLADNRSGEFSTWDLDVLTGELAALPSGQLEALPALDFSALALPPLDGQTDPDAIPEEPEPRAKLGDVWTLGGHRIMCGDATKAGEVERLLDGATPALMVTDPPYGVEYDSSWRDKLGRSPGRARGASTNDDRSDWADAYALFSGSIAYVWMGSLALPVAASGLDACGFIRRSLIIWDKGHIVISRGHYHHRFESCWYAVKKGAQANWKGGRKASTLWEIDKPRKSETGHSAQKPVECMERPIRNHKGDVYDPFVGSGTTIIAAEREHRRCYAIEIEPAYVDVAVARWEAFTGRTATRCP